MTNNKSYDQVFISIFIFVIALVRVATNMSGQLHPLTNFTPLGAMALFGGARLNKTAFAIGFPLLALFLSDELLAMTVFSKYSNGFLYSGWYWVYGSFALMAVVGRIVRNQMTILRLSVGVIICTAIHWVVSDIGVWLHGPYPHTAAGWWTCLVAAIPYERNFLMGTVCYCAVMFGGACLLQARTMTVRHERI